MREPPIAGGDHRPAERRQVVAAQPPGRLRARDRQRRAGHDARRARHADHARRARLPAGRHRRRPAAAARRSEHIERASVVRALRALERAEVALLVIDAVEGMTEQDARVAGYAWERGRALVLLVNKWDAVPATRRGGDHPRRRASTAAIASLDVVPKLFISALQRARRRAHLGRHRRGRRRPPRPPADGEGEPASSSARRRAQAPPMVNGVAPAALSTRRRPRRAADHHHLLQPPPAHHRQLRALRGQPAARRVRPRGHAAARALQGRGRGAD